jgi:DNA polymerase elongation subunit (family B)
MKDIKRLFIDLETGLSPDYELFKPEFKQPRLKKDGTPYADSKTIDEQETEWKSKLALSPLTGQVLMIGYDYEKGAQIDLVDGVQTEYDILNWSVANLNNHDLIIGHYIKDFDLPFIINRCRKHGITPPDLMNKVHGKWYWKEHIIDLRDLWTLGKYNEHISLNNMAKYFGLPVKDETIGKNFEQVFKEDIEKAIAYCKHDVELTKQIYEKLK